MVKISKEQVDALCDFGETMVLTCEVRYLDKRPEFHREESKCPPRLQGEDYAYIRLVRYVSYLYICRVVDGKEVQLERYALTDQAKKVLNVW